MHNGTCTSTEDGLYVCNCTQTGYGGPVCNTGEIKVQVPQVLKVRSNASILFTAPQGSQLVITVSVFPTNLAPSPPTILLGSKSKINLESNVPLGIYTLQYNLSGRDSNIFLKPPNSIVMVVNSTSPFPNQTARTKPAILKEGCCPLQSDQFKCSKTKLILKSTCTTTTSDTSGIIFLTNPQMSLPVSLNGLSTLNNTLQSTPKNQKCVQCNIPGCQSYTYLPSDLNELVAAHSLSATYLENIKPLLPSWVNFNYSVPEINGYQSFGVSDLTAQIGNIATIKKLKGCENILSDADGDGVYSALQVNHPLLAKVGEGVVQFSLDTTSPLCFAVDMCKGLNSNPPLYIVLNPQAQMATLSLGFLEPYFLKGWRINITSLKMHAMEQGYPLSPFYWNGMVLNQFLTPTYDLALKLNLQVPLNYGEIMFKLHFSGLGYGLFENVNVSCFILIVLVCIQIFYNNFPNQQ